MFSKMISRDKNKNSTNTGTGWVVNTLILTLSVLAHDVQTASDCTS